MLERGRWRNDDDADDKRRSRFHVHCVNRDGLVHDAPIDDAPTDGGDDDDNWRGGDAIVTDRSNGGAMIFGGVGVMMMMPTTNDASASIASFAMA